MVGLYWASGPLGSCALVYMNDCLVHSPTLEQHLLDVGEVLEIFRRQQLYVNLPRAPSASSGGRSSASLVTESPGMACPWTRARRSP